MTTEQIADMQYALVTLQTILGLLEQLRDDAGEGDEAVDWVLKQLSE